MKSFATTLTLILLALSLQGQAVKSSGIYLTSYVIAPGNEAVGSIHLLNGTIKSVALSGAHAKEFKVGKGNLLAVNQKKLAQADGYDVVITVGTESGLVTDTVRLVKDTFIRNRVIAHRGAWKNTGATENSIAALNHAVSLGCGGSEFDIHMSSDSLPVIHHDASIDGISIAKTKAETLLSMKLSNGEPLPTLENYLRAGMKQTRTKLILEIKPSELGKEHSIALTHQVMALVNRLHAQAWAEYISFDYDVCLEVMKLAPYARVAYLKGDKSPDDLATDRFYGLDYHFSLFDKNPDWIQKAKQKKLTINVWTVNEQALMEKLLQQKVDFITTNEPELLLTLPGAK